jgi:hypothetical protein
MGRAMSGSEERAVQDGARDGVSDSSETEWSVQYADGRMDGDPRGSIIVFYIGKIKTRVGWVCFYY